MKGLLCAEDGPGRGNILMLLTMVLIIQVMHSFTVAKFYIFSLYIETKCFMDLELLSMGDQKPFEFH